MSTGSTPLSSAQRASARSSDPRPTASQSGQPPLSTSGAMTSTAAREKMAAPPAGADWDGVRDRLERAAA
jgi:hypothetical protein